MKVPQGSRPALLVVVLCCLLGLTIWFVGYEPLAGLQDPVGQRPDPLQEVSSAGEGGLELTSLRREDSSVAHLAGGERSQLFGWIGTVSDAQGRPVHGALVTARSELCQVSALTDSDGEFQLEWAVAIPWRAGIVCASFAGGTSEGFSCQPACPPASLSITMPLGMAFSVSVVRGRDQSVVSDITLIAEGRDWFVEQSTQTDGTAHFLAPFAGLIGIRVSPASKYYSEMSLLATISSGGESENRFTLYVEEISSEIKVRVFDAETGIGMNAVTVSPVVCTDLTFTHAFTVAIRCNSVDDQAILAEPVGWPLIAVESPSYSPTYLSWSVPDAADPIAIPLVPLRPIRLFVNAEPPLTDLSIHWKCDSDFVLEPSHGQIEVIRRLYRPDISGLLTQSGSGYWSGLLPPLDHFKRLNGQLILVAAGFGECIIDASNIELTEAELWTVSPRPSTTPLICTILDYQDNPVGGARVALKLDSSSMPLEGYSNAAGVVQFALPAEGIVTWLVEHENCVQSGVLEASPNRSRELLVRFPKLYSIKGRIVTSQLVTRSTFLVLQVAFNRLDGSTKPSGFVPIEPDGSFSINGIQNEMYALTVMGTAALSAPVNVMGGSENVLLNYEFQTREFVIRDGQSGLPIVNAKLLLEVGKRRVASATGESGIAIVEALPFNCNRVLIQAKGYCSQVLEWNPLSLARVEGTLSKGRSVCLRGGKRSWTMAPLLEGYAADSLAHSSITSVGDDWVLHGAPIDEFTIWLRRLGEGGEVTSRAVVVPTNDETVIIED